MARLRSPLTVTASPCSLPKKNGPIMILDQNPHQTVTRFGYVGAFQCMHAGFLYPCLFTYPPSSKWASSEKMILFLPKSASSVSRSRAHLAKRKWLHEYCQMPAPGWPNDISSAAANAIFKNRSQNIECSFGCLARNAVLLKPNLDNILVLNFCEQIVWETSP